MGLLVKVANVAPVPKVVRVLRPLRVLGKSRLTLLEKDLIKKGKMSLNGTLKVIDGEPVFIRYARKFGEPDVRSEPMPSKEIQEAAVPYGTSSAQEAGPALGIGTSQLEEVVVSFGDGAHT